MRKGLFLFVLMFSMILLSGCKKKPEITVFVMSQCPYGVMAADMLIDLHKDMNGSFDLNFEYIGRIQGKRLSSLHGQSEIDGNKQQLCVKKLFPDKMFTFMKCQNAQYKKIPNNLEECAKKAGIPFDEILACYKNVDGDRLLRESFELARKKRVMGSPTIFIDGKKYQGARQKDSFKLALCKTGKVKGDACNLKFECISDPDCTQKPDKVVYCDRKEKKCVYAEAQEINLLVITDKRCKEKACQFIDNIVSSLRGRVFKKLKVRKLDYNDKEAKQIYKKNGLDYLPALLFDETAMKSPEIKKVSRFMKKKGAYHQLAVGARFDPRKEICDNKVDDTGNGRIDCKDKDCRDNLLCRREKKNTVDLFVMSQCPYGVRAVDAYKEVKELFNKKVRFRLHHISTVLPDGNIRSLHGQPETDENIRQLCAQKYYGKGKKFLEYVWCRNKDIRNPDYKKCAPGMAKIETCFKSKEGKRLLKKDSKLAMNLGIHASPTWLINNKFKEQGIDSNTIKNNICKHNKIKGCDKKLSTNTRGAPAKGACGK